MLEQAAAAPTRASVRRQPARAYVSLPAIVSWRAVLSLAWRVQISLPVYGLIGKRAGCRGVTGCSRGERSEIRERRHENGAHLCAIFDAQLFEAVDGDNVEFRVFLASLEYGLKFGRIAPAFQRLHAVPSKDHDWAVRQVPR